MPPLPVAGGAVFCAIVGIELSKAAVTRSKVETAVRLDAIPCSSSMRIPPRIILLRRTNLVIVRRFVILA